MQIKVPVILFIVLFQSACTDLGLVKPQTDWRVHRVETDVKNHGIRRSKSTSVKIRLNQISLDQPVLEDKTFSVPRLASKQSHHIETDFSELSDTTNNHLRDVFRVDTRITRSDWNILNNSSLKPVFNTNLPIVIVNSLNNTIVDEPAIQAKMDIIKNKPVVLGSAKQKKSAITTPGINLPQPQNYVTDNPNVYSGNIEIEIRGKSSQGFCKKQYKVETQFGDGSNRNVSLLGMPEENDWILHAPYSDKTLIRNKMAYSLWEDMGWYAPRAKFVELLINRSALAEVEPDCIDKTNSFWMYILNERMAGLYEYNGLYLLIEKIKRDQNRLNVTKLQSSDSTEPAISGGYILKTDKLDPGDVEGVDYFVSNNDTRVVHVYPKPNDITSVQRTWIKNHINTFEAVLNGSNFADPENGYRKYIDVDSFVDFFLIQEFFKNIDGFRISTYFHKDRNQKIKMGPAWDFNLSTGNADYCNGASTTGWYKDLVDCNATIPIWWSRLLSDPWFREQLVNRWSELRGSTFSQLKLISMIDSNTHYIKHAARRNFARWDILGKDIWPNAEFPPTYAEEITNLKNWITGRLTWIDDNLALIGP